MRISDWSSDVFSSDLAEMIANPGLGDSQKENTNTVAVIPGGSVATPVLATILLQGHAAAQADSLGILAGLQMRLVHTAFDNGIVLRLTSLPLIKTCSSAPMMTCSIVFGIQVPLSCKIISTIALRVAFMYRIRLCKKNQYRKRTHLTSVHSSPIRMPSS